MKTKQLPPNKPEKTHLLHLIAQAWQNLPLGFKGVFVITLPLAVLLASLGSLYIRELESTKLENQLKQALQNQRDIQTVHTQLLEASTGVRDYLLTGDKHFLNIFFEAEKMLPKILATLEDRLETDHQKQRLSVISPLVAKNLEDLQALSTNEAEIASDRLIAQFKSQVETLDRLRSEIEALNAEEALLVEQDQQEIFIQRQQNLVVTLIATVAGIIGSLMAVWIFSRTIVKRVRLLRDSAGHLARAEALDLPSSSRDELGQLSDELDHASQLLAKNISDALQARQEAEEASASKSMFLSRTSHELRTPLNAILGFAQLLEQDLPAGKQLNSVLLIKGAGLHLLKLINEVLEIARIESGETSLELAPTLINDLLEEATHYIAPLGKIRDIEIKCDATPDLWAMANRQKLLQVILNLLSNALKYGPVSSVVQLNAYRRDDIIVIEVQDSGAGIPITLRERLFTPFDRLGAENTKVEGTGLGLALSKQIMLAMHGSIDLSEEKSLFWIEIAACEPNIRPLALTPEVKKSKYVNLSDKHSILYVEDNMSNRALVEAIILRQRDLRIHCVSTIKDAKQYLAEVVPSLLLIDLNLPDGSGESLVHYVNADPRLKNTPMMILSADALPDTISRLQAAGITHYMTKPLDVAIFNKQIRELIHYEQE
ncbi:MAG: ATP-binding protein [Methylotenera sp.]|nr:ATP-binding protein [Methylotenera sp.]MDO9233478.1 ATP-binding protein [Methylotenera sp.]MDO9389123.1 ATP-binding protein [Methylotenera sp.]MDP2102863.1 ATP-binding protein [Methylotenera sp.]MDP2282049.1 ATP-binding protein [Methylotenera sp.]